MHAMTSLKLFESKKIHSHWSEEENQWYFSVVDVVEVLTESNDPTDYLKKLRKCDEELGSYIGTNCPQVAMLTETGKKRKTGKKIVSQENYKKLAQKDVKKLKGAEK